MPLNAQKPPLTRDDSIQTRRRHRSPPAEDWDATEQQLNTGRHPLERQKMTTIYDPQHRGVILSLQPNRRNATSDDDDDDDDDALVPRYLPQTPPTTATLEQEINQLQRTKSHKERAQEVFDSLQQQDDNDLVNDNELNDHPTKGSVPPNVPLPSLEYRPLYYLARPFPQLAGCLDAWIRFRWKLSYPLSQRVPFSRAIFRKWNWFGTYGDMLLLLPFVLCFVGGIWYSWIQPDVTISGHLSRTPLIFAFVTAVRNSILTLLLGMPFEQALWYHKVAARLAYINGIFHTIVCVRSIPGSLWISNTVNAGGTLILGFMTLLIMTAIPTMIRKRWFEVFRYVHIFCCIGMVLGAFYHTGIIVPLLVSATWGLDWILRSCTYHKIDAASLRIVSDSVVEVMFPKAFDYNPGQYVYMAVPALGIWEWHPFSISSSPGQKIMTFHIRRTGTDSSWTSALYQLAAYTEKVPIYLDGPYGSVGVNLFDDKSRYDRILLVSGGIGVTPMQSIANQIMYEHATGQRPNLQKLQFVWMERDPTVLSRVDVVRRSATMKEPPLEPSPVGADIASTLLSLSTCAILTDQDLEDYYTCEEFAEFDMDSFSEEESMYGDDIEENAGKRRRNGIYGDDYSVQQSFLDVAYDTYPSYEDSPATTSVSRPSIPSSSSSSNIKDNPLDLQVYLTSGATPQEALDFVKYGRPDLKQIFLQLKEEAICQGSLQRVAVCVCAPERLVSICHKASVKYSNHKVCFDFHHEIFG